MLESLFSGGVVGVLGSLFGNVVSYFNKRQEHKNKIEEMKLEHQHASEQIRLEAEYRKDELLISAERDVDVAANQALAASYKDTTYEGQSKLLTVAEFVRKLTRPALTFLFVFLTTAVYFNSDNQTQALVARAVIAMTATIVSWWFADRQIAKRIGEKVL